MGFFDFLEWLIELIMTLIMNIGKVILSIIVMWVCLILWLIIFG